VKALVTGCAGFIGSHLAGRLLEEGYEVVGIDCFTPYYPKEIKDRNIASALKQRHFKFIEADILDLKEFPEVDYVFHQAAQPGVRGSWGDKFEIYVWNNILATQKLLEFYKDESLKKFIYASSSSIYGDAELPLKESAAPKPVSPYGVTKLAGENLCYLYHKSYEMPTISLRYFTVYGPRQRPDMAIHKMVSAISNGEKVAVFGDGKQTRDFTYIDDVTEANVLAARSEVQGKVFNIGGGSRISVNDLVRLISKLLNKEAKITHIEEQKGDVRHTLAHIEQAGKELGWRPQIEITEGLRRYIDSIPSNAR
jgi:UDP-glucose 4-epimerase